MCSLSLEILSMLYLTDRKLPVKVMPLVSFVVSFFVSFLDVSITKQALILEQQLKRKQFDIHEREMIFTVM